MTCPNCDSENVEFLQEAEGSDAWYCNDCERIFTFEEVAELEDGYERFDEA